MSARVQHSYHILTIEGYDSHRWTIAAPKQESKGSHRPEYKDQLHAIFKRKVDRYTGLQSLAKYYVDRKHNPSRMTQPNMRS